MISFLLSYFSTTVKERLTEGGASGAFFFFSKDEKFIAKSCTLAELETLRDNAKSFADYLTSNKYSYISKVSTFHFPLNQLISKE